jgi:hypothetical protein
MELRATVKKLPFAPTVYALMRLLRGRNARFVADYSQTSGVGSDLNATKTLVSAFRSSVESLSVRSILDIPCGDFVWMQNIDLGEITYIGADIIESLIVSHQRSHASARKTFRTLDLVTDDLPQVDLILCRDCLVHFSHRLAKKAINNIKRSNSRYLLATTFPQHANNNDIVTGTWHPLNLCAPPFNFPAPVQLIDERHAPPYEDKSLGLWNISDLPTF